jgi:hypothetical protein
VVVVNGPSHLQEPVRGNGSRHSRRLSPAKEEKCGCTSYKPSVSSPHLLLRYIFISTFDLEFIPYAHRHSFLWLVQPPLLYFYCIIYQASFVYLTMLFKVTSVLATLMVVSSVAAVALPVAVPEPAPVEILVEGQGLIEFAEIQCENTVTVTKANTHGLEPICPTLNTTRDNGCIRCKSTPCI